MKASAILSLVLGTAFSAFSANPGWKQVGTPIPPRADLEVRWAALPKQFPAKVWVYQLLPGKFPPRIILNLLTFCSLEEKEKTGDDPNGMNFQNFDGTRKLAISFSGDIHYEIPDPHSWGTNLSKGVPEMSQLPTLATNLLRQLDISPADVTGYFEGEKFNLSESGSVFFTNHLAITNIETRTVRFRRSVDGLPVVGGDGGSFSFGEKGQLSELHLEWHGIKRTSSARTLSKKPLIKSLLQGRAFQGLVPYNFGKIDWFRVKTVTIKKVWPSYYSGNSELLYPYLALCTTVQTQRGDVDVEIDCPLIDETKL